MYKPLTLITAVSLITAYTLIIPTIACADYPTQGKASFYTVQSCHKEGTSGIMANGKPLIDSDMTCALFSHYYIGKKVKVTNISNGKSVVCLVSDYGPNAKLFYEHNRIIDLSAGAFKQLSPLSKGIINIRLEIL